MPGYLTNRFISIDVASAADLSALEATINGSISTTNTNLTNLTNRVTEAEGNIEDLQLNIGV
jgi:peptidoglycan hydrolase CwlO-like protein